ncbi:MAG: hypothetical protein C5B50_03420 [Verrucomicrobia bacterium]|nr:MAG: hypothetical protein C5B50_03420 [Verrucomicrobiota bacterium]
MKAMKTKLWIFSVILLGGSLLNAATNDLSSILQRGLLEEEANHDLEAAIQAYQSVATQFDRNRKLAATAIFRLGECYRKQGNTNAAVTQYQRIVSEFSDQSALVALSREYLGGSTTGAQRADAGEPAAFGARASSSTAADNRDEIRRIRNLIQESPDLINAPDKNGETLLQSAAAKGNLRVVEYLLSRGAAVNGIQEFGPTPLHYAVANGHKAVVSLLLTNGASPSARTRAGITPLHIAAAKGYEAVAEALLDSGASISARTDGYESPPSFEDLHYTIGPGRTALHLASEHGYTAVVESLVARKADLNAQDNEGQTALGYAAVERHESILKALLSAHADPNAGRRNLPLFAAVFWSNMPMVKLLLSNGAHADATCDGALAGNLLSGRMADGKFSALSLAVGTHKPAIVTELIRFRADPNSTGPENAPLLFAALDHPPTLRALLEGGADPNKARKDGSPPLVIAASQKTQEAVELLVAHHAEVNSTNRDGWSALFFAVKDDNLKPMAELLIKSGADVRATDKDGGTPLHVAVSNSAHQEVELLLAYSGTDPNVRNRFGETPLDIAKRMESPGGPGARAFGPGFAVPAAPFPGIPTRPIRSSVSTDPGGSKPTESSLAELLRQRGAVDDLADFSSIRVTRKGWANGGPVIVFKPATRGWNQFTLLEAIYGASGFSLPWPDFSKITIHRPDRATPGKEKDIHVDLMTSTNTFDCTKDMWLEFGDIVEIPEREHTLTESSAFFRQEPVADSRRPGLNVMQEQSPKKCIEKKVKVVVRGREIEITLGWMPLLGNLLGTEQARSLLNSSSDFYKVKVRREDPLTHQTKQFTVNVRDAWDNHVSYFTNDLWLRDGDIVEVPDKP